MTRDANDVIREQGVGALRQALDAGVATNGGSAKKRQLSLPLGFVDAAAWQDAEVPPRRWLAHDRIPMRNVCLLTGDGAAGKTTIALQLGVGVCRSGEWLGAVIDECGDVMFVTAEEENDEIQRRLAAILDHNRLEFRDISGFRIKSLADEDPLLAVPDVAGVIKPTPLFMRLLKEVQAKSPRLIIIEAAADVFGGNEINRGQVRQFIALLRQLARAADGAVVLITHPSLQGLSSGSGSSGSTGWNNSVRSRLYFTTAKAQADEPDLGLRELKVMKNNYGPPGEVVRVRWQRGAFVMEPRAGSFEVLANDAKTETVFLGLLERFTREGRTVGDKKGHTYAPAMFANEAEAKAAGLRKEVLADAMRRLFAASKIHVEQYGRPSNPHSRIAAGPASPVDEPPQPAS